MSRYKLVIGDWSGDGHGMSENVYVDVFGQVYDEQLINGYRRSVERYGVDLHDIANGYEQNSVPADLAERLLADGLNPESLEEWEGEYSVAWVDGMAHLIMFYCGLSSDEYRIVEDKTPILTDILPRSDTSFFGYGLFGY